MPGAKQSFKTNAEDNCGNICTTAPIPYLYVQYLYNTYIAAPTLVQKTVFRKLSTIIVWIHVVDLMVS